LDIDAENMEEEEGANIDLDAQRKGKSVVIKTSTRQVLHYIQKESNKSVVVL
jgi:26S proteasome regulatory subunit T5